MINEEKIANTKIQFDLMFARAFAEMQGDDAIWRQLSIEVPTTKPTVQFNWLSQNPVFKEWVGERDLAKLGNEKFSISVKKWANGLEVDQDDLDDDQLGLYGPQILRLAEQAAIHRTNRMVDYLVNGFATTEFGACFDGLAFFSDSHAFGDNKGTAALDASSYEAAHQKMMEFVDDNGEPLNVQGTHLIVGPKKAAAGRTLVESQIVSGDSNPNFGTAKLVVAKKLRGTYDDYWFLADLSKAVKPLIMLMRREVGFRSVTGADSVDKFKLDKLYFGADARYEVGYGLPQLVYGSIVA